MEIELPKDAKGRKIPLDVDALYTKSGKRQAVFGWRYHPTCSCKWRVLFLFDESDISHAPEYYYLTPPGIDSWDKLLDDLSDAGDARYEEACAYFHRDKNEDGCSSCPGGEDGCTRIAMRDIADRIRKLMGEAE